MGQFTDKQMRYLRVGLGWDCDENVDYDLDLCAFLLDADGKAANDESLVFYNHSEFGEKALVFSGDNTTGRGDGMDESIFVDLERIPQDVTGMVFCVTFDHSQEQSKFGQVPNAAFAVCRVDDPYDKGSDVIASVSLSSQYPDCSGLVVLAVSRGTEGWEYEMLCESANGGLQELCGRYGLEVE